MSGSNRALEQRALLTDRATDSWNFAMVCDAVVSSMRNVGAGQGTLSSPEMEIVPDLKTPPVRIGK